MNTAALTTMDAAVVAELATRATDIPEIDGGTMSHLEISEYADGSGRSVARVTMIDGDFEQCYRIISPAPWNSPAWASHLNYWRYEVRTSLAPESWLEIEVDA